MSENNTAQHITLLNNATPGAMLVLLQVSHTEICKTIILASLGAIVSYGVSGAIKAVVLLIKKRR
jgi:hypothetical protein